MGPRVPRAVQRSLVFFPQVAQRARHTGEIPHFTAGTCVSALCLPHCPFPDLLSPWLYHQCLTHSPAPHGWGRPRHRAVPARKLLVEPRQHLPRLCLCRPQPPRSPAPVLPHTLLPAHTKYHVDWQAMLIRSKVLGAASWSVWLTTLSLMPRTVPGT